MRQTITTAGEIAGGTLLTVGCALYSQPLGFVVGGTLVALFSWLASR